MRYTIDGRQFQVLKDCDGERENSIDYLVVELLTDGGKEVCLGFLNKQFGKHDWRWHIVQGEALFVDDLLTSILSPTRYLTALDAIEGYLDSQLLSTEACLQILSVP